MSTQAEAVARIRATGRFTVNRQPTTGVLTCKLLDHYGATIYITSVGDFHIRVGALEHQRFPNDDHLYRYVREHGTVTQWRNDNSYVLAPSHIDDVMGIIVARRR